MTLPKMLMIGHSHLAALETAQMQRRASGAPASLPITVVQLRKPAYRMTPDVPPTSPEAFSPAVRELVEKLQPELIVSVVAGNAHTVLSLIEHPVPFDFVMEPHAALDESRQLLPLSLVRTLLEGQMRMGLRVMRALSHLAKVPVVHLAAPPPIPSEAHIRAHPEAFAEALAEGKVTPAAIRLKLWHLHEQRVAEHCRELGFAQLPVPEGTQDEHGFLRPEGWNLDPAHANAWYGERVLQQLEAHAAALAAPTAQRAPT